MWRLPLLATMVALGSTQPSLACSTEDAAVLKSFGCNGQQIARRCPAPTGAGANRGRDSLSGLKEMRRPNQGVLTGSGERIAPFRITTPNDDGYYFLKLARPDDKKGAVMTIFMAAGQTYETKVPLGSYVLRYASGKEWYGQKHLFGPCRTQFFEAQTVMTFSREGNRLSGHSIELIKQAGGNLSTRGVDEDDF